MRPWPFVAAIVCVFLLGALPSTAAAGWLPPLPLDVSGPPSGQPAIGLAGDGRLGAAWQGAGQIRAATRPPGASLEPGQIVSEAGQVAFSPALHFDAAGNALLVWLRDQNLQYMTRAAGTGAFGDLHTIDPSSESIIGFRLAMAPSGEAVLLWQTIDTDDIQRDDHYIRAAVRPSGGGTFGQPQQLDTGFEGNDSSFSFDSLDVAIDAQGGAHATWASSKFSGSQTRTKVLAAVRAPGGSFVPQLLDERLEDPSDFFPDAAVSAPAVASDAAGNALLVWQFRGGAKNDFRLQQSVRSPGGAFGAFSNFGPAPSDAPMNPDVAIAPDGRALVAWQTGPSGAQTIQACLAAPGAPCGAPQTLSSAGANVSQPVAAIGASGHTLVAWQSATSVLASAGPPGGPLAPEELMASDATLGKGDAAVDPAGHAVVAYQRAGAVAEARVHDPVAPLITSFVPPPGGPALAPLAFAGAASDTWGPVTLTWDFGDGSTAPGPNASHAYAGAGTYLARLTATDGGGNVAGREAGLTITGSSADTTAPVIEAFGLTRRRFAVARRPTPVSAAQRRAPRGSAFRVTTSEPATITIAIQRRLRGRRLRGRCVPRARSGRRCTVYKGVGKLRRSLAAGPRVVQFSGRIGRRALRPGPYRARVIAVDGAGNRSRTRTATFTVVPAG